MTNRTRLFDALHKYAIVILFVSHLALHIPFLISEHFGEADAARISNDSIMAAYNGIFSNMDYTVYSSPLYSDILRYLIKFRVIGISQIPFWLCLISVAASAVATAAIYLFVLRLTGSALAGLGAAWLVQLMPPFWFTSIYGFSSMLAIALFMVSLVLFDIAIVSGGDSQVKRYAILLLCLITYVLSVLTKLDTLLASAAFVLPVWKSGLSIKRKAILVLILVAVTLGTYLLFLNYADSLVDVPHWTRSFSGFSTGYPSLVRRFISSRNLEIIARAVGILSIPAALAGVLLIGWRKEWRAAILWLVLAALPLVIVWGTKKQNTARHNLVPGLFLCIILALPLTMRNWKKWAWAALLCAVCVVNYFYWPPNSDPLIAPSGRLMASTRLLKERVERLHRLGSAIAQLPHEKVAVIGDTYDHSYFRYEILRSDELVYVSHTCSLGIDDWGDRQTLEMNIQGSDESRSFLFLRSDKEIDVPDYQEYFWVVDGEELGNEFARRTELEGKWVPLDQLLSMN